MEEQSIAEEFSEVIEELIDILSEKVSDHEVNNYANMAKDKAELDRRVKRESSSKVLDKYKKDPKADPANLSGDIYDAKKVALNRIERKAREAAKRPENELNVRKQSKMIDRSLSNGKISAPTNPFELRDYAGLDAKKTPSGVPTPKDPNEIIGGVSYYKLGDEAQRRVAKGHAERSKSIFKGEKEKPFTNYTDEKRINKSVKRHAAKEAKRAKIKESLEALICSNLSEATKVEILESIRNYLVD